MKNLDSEKLEIFARLEGPQRPLPPSFVRLLHAVVRRYPANAAILESGVTVTSFQELWDRAAALTGELRTAGVKPGEVVALGIGKSADYIVALIGAWLAGAAFVPVDPDYPQDRKEFLLKDSGARLLVCRSWDLPAFAGCRVKTVVPGRNICARTDFSFEEAQPESPGWLIYTSGSSGNPKGVLVPMRGATNFIAAQIQAFNLTPQDRALFFSAASFDASISDIGTALLSGACLCIEETKALAPSNLLKTIQARRITHADLPPALVARLNAAEIPAGFKTLIIGGEVCPAETVRAWSEKCRVVCVYGPTETTVCSSLTVCGPDWEEPLIGDPLPNTTYLLVRPAGDQEGAGELWIGGAGVATCYQNQPLLTAERFVSLNGERFYKSGDRIGLLAGNRLKFLGRIDRQFKIRGLRIEPGEIERAISGHAAVSESAVLKVKAEQGDTLCAFYALKAAADALEPRDLRAWLLAKIPRWLIPERIIRLEQLPRNAHGKVDYSFLKKQVTGEKGAEPLPPGGARRNATEAALAPLFGRILQRSQLSPDDNFFDLGGDSIGVLELSALASGAGLKVEPEMVIKHPSIALLAAAIEQNQGRKNVAPVKRAAELELESTPAPALLEQLERARALAAPVASPRAILLSGATGLLGGELLLNLLKRTDARIYCLVRGGDQAGARERLLRTMQVKGHRLAAEYRQRITVVPADLRAPEFGLPAARYLELAREVEAVYHCAAEVNSLTPYEHLKAPNVDATARMVEFCFSARRKTLHYASTLSVFVASDRNYGICREDDELAGTGQVFGGYAQSKWVAERMLHKLIDRGAGDIFIYRFGLITGHSQTGHTRPNEFIHMLISDLAKVGNLPAEAAKELFVDITPLDFAAKAMCEISLRAQVSGHRVYHIANSEPLSLSVLSEAMRAENHPLRLVTEEVWKEAVAAARKQGIGARSLLTLCRLTGDFAAHRAVDLFQATGIIFGMQNTRAVLAGTGISAPRPELELIRKYVRSVFAGR